MRKVIAAMNMTLDGYCDHRAMDADDQIHHHYTELLRNSGLAITPADNLADAADKITKAVMKKAA